MQHDQDKDEEQDFLQDEPEVVQFIILEGTQDGAVTGAVKSSESRKHHQHEGDFYLHAIRKEDSDHSHNQKDDERNDPDKTGGGTSNFRDASRVLGDLANHHSRQTGVSHELRDHGEGKDPIVFAEFSNTNMLVVGNDDRCREINEPADNTGSDPNDSVLYDPLGLFH